jgi:hypothetical protein
MISAQIALIISGGIIAVLLVVCFYLFSRRTSQSNRNINVQSSLQQMRSIGQLSVFKVITKEIATETDHSWGEFGRKYLSWVLTTKKMAMIFEFVIDFKYDLRRPEFNILAAENQEYIIKMPPCFYEAHIRDIQFYDEQRSRFMPWLLPNLLNGFFTDGFTEEDKNRLVLAAKTHAEEQALKLIANLQSEVQTSAKTTLLSIARAFGASNVVFDFPEQEKITLNIGLADKSAA